MSLIKAAGAGEQSTGFYKLLLDQSLKFNDDDAQYLTRTPTSAGNRDVWTWSCWLKHTDQRAVGRTLFSVDNGSASNYYLSAELNTSGELSLSEYTGSAYTYRYAATPLYRDPLAWMNVVWAVDTTQGTAANRVKLYVNGVQVTDFRLETDPSQNADTLMNSTNPHYIGCTAGQSSGSGAPYRFYDGYLAEINFIDGTQLTAASFGETKDGIWIPKDTSGLTFGTNGFHLTFKDDVVSEGFNTVTYTGTGAAQSISGLGFDPDFVWVKERSSTSGHILSNSVAGATKLLTSNTTDSEQTDANKFSSFDGDGFSVGTSGAVNADGDTYVGWCWEAGGAPTADNSAGAGATPTAGSVKIDGSNLGSALAGTIPATRISANTARGFSIISFVGNATAGATVAHSLNSTPEMLILKNRDSSSEYWTVFHKDVGNTKSLFLNSTGAVDTSSAYWNNTSPTSSVFSLGGNPVNNGSGNDIICYAFHSVTGYSKFGSYSGSGSSGKSVTGLGFKPAFVMIKRTDSTGDWRIVDNTRSVGEYSEHTLLANDSAAEADLSTLSFDSDGFSLQSTAGSTNASGATYIYMAFADTREAAFFKDVTTNGNHFTPVNLDYRDSVPDTPTNNFCTLNPLALGIDGTLSEGNLKIVYGTASTRSVTTATMGVSSGKWYWEVLSNSDGGEIIGITNVSNDTGFYPGVATGSAGYYGDDGSKYVDGSNSSYGASFATDIIGFALDMDAGTLVAYKNNSSQGTLVSSLTGNIFPAIGDGGASGTSSNTFNFGQDSSFSGAKATANANADSKGHGSFAYAPPSGFLALCSQNLPDVAIIDGTENFNTVLYTGDGATKAGGGQAISAVGFQPSWTWIKNRGAAQSHFLNDAVRGAGKNLFTNSTAAENVSGNAGDGFSAFGSDGFTVNSTYGSSDTNTGTNANSNTYVAWNWLAGTAFSNDASATSVGTIDSSGQVNTKAGFSIVKYTGSGSTDQQTISVGLSWSGKDKLVIIKNRDASTNWLVNSSLLAANKVLRLNTTDNDSQVNSSGYITYETFGFRTYNGANILNLANDYIAYCFHSVEGYSKVGSYVGNGNADGTFVYTGFRPAWIMQKKSNNTGHWHIWDSTRNTSNEITRYLSADDTSTEATDGGLDILSNGFKPRKTGSGLNASGDTYVYLAFGSQAYKFSNAF